MGTLLKFQPRLRVHYIELSDLTNSVPNIPLLKKNADIGRQTQILSDLHSDDKKRRDVGKRTLHEDTKRLAIKSSREKQTLNNNIDPSSILISEGEENLIDLASKIKSEREALAAELSKYPEQEKQYLNSKTDADLARTLMNALTDSYMTNSTGYSPYSYINPYSPEGQDRLDFATSNAALSFLSSVATGALVAPVGVMIPIVGPFGTAIAVGEGVGGDLLGRYLMSKVTDNPYALAAGGALGGSLGAFHGAGTTQRMLKAARKAAINTIARTSFYFPLKNAAAKASQLWRNQEYNNFLNTVNGDNYYELVQSTAERPKIYYPNEEYFISHTTPWAEFAETGNIPNTLKTDASILNHGLDPAYFVNAKNKLYEFPHKTFGDLKATGAKLGEYKQIFDESVQDLGRLHLKYGELSSGPRGEVPTMGNFPNTYRQGWGLTERPLLKTPAYPNGVYDYGPVYEDMFRGPQTIVRGDKLIDALLHSNYNIYERTPNGVQRILFLGEPKMQLNHKNLIGFNRKGGKLIPKKQVGGVIPNLIKDFQELINPIVYVGKKGTSPNREAVVKRIYNEHLVALRNNPNTKGWDNLRLSNLAKAMTAHKIAENGWVYGEGGPWAGYGTAKNALEFVNGMFKNFDKSMNSTNYTSYVKNLDYGKLGRYNSVNPRYIQMLLTDFGPNSRVWGYLNNIN